MPAPMPQQAATARMLKTAEPTMVPMPMSPSVMNVPMQLTNSSGADVAAAMNVAPATSLDISRAAVGGGGWESGNQIARLTNPGGQNIPVHIFSTAGTKYLSQTTASARNKYRLPMA